MTKMLPCPQCEANRNVTLVSHTERVTMKGKAVEFVSQSYQCEDCGEEFDTAETLDNNLERAREEYDRCYRTLSREELVALRGKYNASQKAFGLLLGFGEATMNSYEKGNSPNSTHRLLLRLTEKPEVFRVIYEENKHKIGLTQRKRIEQSEGYRTSEVPLGTSQGHWREFSKRSIVSDDSSSRAAVQAEASKGNETAQGSITEIAL
jgi:putative zinc finger/helix-turn-helix YgiT family protein